MKVLISAYACDAGRGSEGGAGWAWTQAAAGEHDVWLLTHETNRRKIEDALRADPALAERLHPVFLRNAPWARFLRRGVTRFLYYVLWQHTVCRSTAEQLHAAVGFDVAHHVTYASDWMPVGVSRIAGLPLVWGPVGGASTVGGPRLWLQLGARNFVAEAVRAVVLTLFRELVGRRVARRAAVVLGQNADVAVRFAPVPVTVEPHVALAEAGAPHRRAAAPGARPTAVFAGRLLGWKGLHLAVKALARPAAAQWRLTVFGAGPQRARLERLSARLGLSDRISFRGARPRAEVLAALADADAMLFPSIHDAAGWSVAEAVAEGCPVVGLALGGPVTLTTAADAVLVPPRGDVVGGLAAALGRVHELSPAGGRWAASRLPGFLRTVYQRAAHLPAQPAGRER